MKYDTVVQITNSYTIDFEAPGAAMRLAWKWTAQELWAARKFDTDHSAIFAKALREAWVHVKKMREQRRRADAVKNNPRIIELQKQKDMLQNRSFAMSIREDEQRINAEIAAIMASA
jgi:hypothetical protein